MARWLILIWLLGMWSYLDVWAHNIEDLPGFHFRPFATWTISFALIGSIVALVARGHFNVPIDAAGALGATVTVLVQSSHLVGRVFPDGGLGRAAVLVVLLFAAGGAILGVARRFRLMAGFAVVTFALVSIAVAEIWVSGGRDTADRAETAMAEDGLATPSKPIDVYVIVLDAYARSDVLRDEFGFDNSRFEGALMAQGFTIVRRATANYVTTEISVTSLLEGTHLVTGRSSDAGLSRLREIYSGQNALFQRASDSGRAIHMFDNAWTFTRCGPIVEHCVTTTSTELDHAIAQRTPLPLVSNRWRINPWVHTSVDQLRTAVELADSPRERPRLVFIHSLIPHAPFQLDANCEEYWDADLDGYRFESEDPSDQAIRNAGYAGQVSCTNRLILELVGALPPDAAVVVTGDHGARLRYEATAVRTEEQFSRIFGTFTAFRFPLECDAIDDDATVVAVGAALQACIFGASPGVEETDRWFLTRKGAGGTWEVTEVTATIRVLR